MKKDDLKNNNYEMIINERILKNPQSTISQSQNFINNLSNDFSKISITEISYFGITLKNFLERSNISEQFSTSFFDALNFIFHEAVTSKNDDNFESSSIESKIYPNQSNFLTLKHPTQESESGFEKNNFAKEVLGKSRIVQEKEAQEKIGKSRIVQEKEAQEKIGKSRIVQEKEAQEKIGKSRIVQEKEAQEKIGKSRIVQEKEAQDLETIDSREGVTEFPTTDFVFQNNEMTTDSFTILDPAPLLNMIPTTLSISDPIKIHVGQYSENLTSQFNADAVTLKDHVFFAKDKFDITTPRGISLLVHEITHVQQQKNKNFNLASTNNSNEQEAIDNENKTIFFFNTNNNAIIKSTEENQEFSNNSFLQTDRNNSFFVPEIIENEKFFTIYSELENSQTLLNKTTSVNSTSFFNNTQSDIPSYDFGKNDSPSFTFSFPHVNKENIVASNNDLPTQLPQNQFPNSVPMAADENRSTQTPPTPNMEELPTVTEMPSIGIEKIADQVFEKISKQILRDRDRLGYR